MVNDMKFDSETENIGNIHAYFFFGGGEKTK